MKLIDAPTGTRPITRGMGDFEKVTYQELCNSFSAKIACSIGSTVIYGIKCSSSPNWQEWGSDGNIFGFATKIPALVDNFEIISVVLPTGECRKVRNGELVDCAPADDPIAAYNRAKKVLGY